MSNNKMKIITTSWDDGHKQDLKLAKLLKKYNIKGTFYISPNNREFNKKDLLSNSEIKKISQDFEIGAHTMTHPLLPKISEKEAFKEIKDSKIFLEQLINKDIEMFCYPRGLYDEKIKKLVKQAGFDGARTMKRFLINPPTDFFEFGTTTHAFTHRMNFTLKLPLKVNFAFASSLLTKEWVKVAKETFNYVNQNGGIWHLWGHSWEIEKNNLWIDLEEVLKHISERENFHCSTNGETLEYLKKET